LISISGFEFGDNLVQHLWWAATFVVKAVLTIFRQNCLGTAVEPESLMSRQLQGEADGVTPAGFFSS
jgi:hypothetical protein